jgi:hypothetical protein
MSRRLSLVAVTFGEEPANGLFRRCCPFRGQRRASDDSGRQTGQPPARPRPAAPPVNRASIRQFLRPVSNRLPPECDQRRPWPEREDSGSDCGSDHSDQCCLALALTTDRHARNHQGLTNPAFGRPTTRQNCHAGGHSSYLAAPTSQTLPTEWCLLAESAMRIALNLPHPLAARPRAGSKLPGEPLK